MKKRKNIKIIFNVFLSFILILLFFCGDLQVYADSINILWSTASTTDIRQIAVCILDYGTDGVYTARYYFDHTNFATNFNIDFNFIPGHYYKIAVGRFIRYTSNNTYATQYYLPSINESLVSLSKQSNVVSFNAEVDSDILSISLSAWVGNISTSSASVLNDSFTYAHASDYFYNFLYVGAATPSPEPTPTPAPTPTPLPVDYDDTQFWGRMNDMAEGGWSAITATFNGIFNNTVFRNLVVYVPLFGAIIYLFVYLLFMGSD